MARCTQSYTSKVIISNRLKRTEEGYLELLQVQDSRSMLPRLRGWAIMEESAYGSKAGIMPFGCTALHRLGAGHVDAEKMLNIHSLCVNNALPHKTRNSKNAAVLFVAQNPCSSASRGAGLSNFKAISGPILGQILYWSCPRARKG